MSVRTKRYLAASALIISSATTPRPAQALMHFGATPFDQNFNTSAIGTIAEPVFDSVGILRYPTSNPTSFHFTAVPIGPSHLLTANHVRGVPGDIFTLNGVEHVIESVTPLGGNSMVSGFTDIAVIKVSGSFGSWMPLYNKSDELGKQMVLVGAGMIKGAEISLNGAPIGHNYAETIPDTKRWGTNTVSAIEPFSFGAGSQTTLLALDYNGNEGPNEAQMSFGDSGAIGFILDEGEWKVAGAGFAISGYYSKSADGSGAFTGAIPDTRGLYIDNGRKDSNNNPIFDYIDPAIYSSPVPSASYLTRVSPYFNEILGLTAPEPSSVALLLLGVPVSLLFRRRRLQRRREG